MEDRATEGDKVDIPTDLGNALSEEPGALDVWRRLTPEQQKEHIAGLESAPDALARERCVRQLVRDLSVRVVQRSRR